MPIETRGESFPEGFSVGEEVLYTVDHRIEYGLAKGESPRIVTDFQLGIIEKIERNDDTSSVKISDVRSVNIGTGVLRPIFITSKINEGDTAILIMHVRDNKFNMPLEPLIELLEDSMGISQI